MYYMKGSKFDTKNYIIQWKENNIEVSMFYRKPIGFPEPNVGQSSPPTGLYAGSCVLIVVLTMYQILC